MNITPDKAGLLAGDDYKYAGYLAHHHALVPKSKQRHYEAPEYLLISSRTGEITRLRYEPFSDDEALNKAFMRIEERLQYYADII